MGVAVAASCAFLTPIGHKNNTIIMGPGGYKSGDYWRKGLALEVIVMQWRCRRSCGSGRFERRAPRQQTLETEMKLRFSSDHKGHAEEIAGLFSATFTDSEGEEEGRLIETLARNMIATTKEDDLYVFSSWDGSVLTGCIIFSRLTFDQDDRAVFVLAPVAVATGRQGQGVGQRLLRFGLEALRDSGADVAITYGDPTYYAKVGFAPITEAMAKAPLPLSQPEGWLAQSLTDKQLEPLKGPSRCVQALNSRDYW